MRISELTDESAVTLTGEVVADERVRLGGVEIRLHDLEVDAPAEPELPVTPESALDKRIDWRYLDLRRPDRRLIFEVQTTVEHAMREHWRAEGFFELHTPKFMGSASESGAELFKVEYFERTAYLAQSPQFYKQMAMAAGFGKVFEVGPVFRANPSFTSRHDTEFTSVDVEISWIDSHEDVMAFEEAWLAHVFEVVAAEHGDAIRETFGVEVAVPSLPFPRVTIEEAKALLREHGHEHVPGPDDDLDPPSERALCAIVAEQHGHEFVFVTDYPTAVRPFYHMRYPDRPGLTKSFDLLWRGIEITTGAQREHRLPVLLAAGARQARGDRADPVLPRLLPLRRAAARRLRLRPHAPVDADARAGQRARGDLPLPRPQPAGAVGVAWDAHDATWSQSRGAMLPARAGAVRAQWRDGSR